MGRLLKHNLFTPARVLLPKGDLEHFAVVACDQYTSEPDYWRQVEATVGDRPSALRLVLPEIYLGSGAHTTREIHENMRSYLDGGVFRDEVEGYILVERTQSNGERRVGVVCAVDLEQYDYAADSKSFIRPTEGTVTERLPARVEIRSGAALELPHVMLLIDDYEYIAIEPLYDRRDEFEQLYDFELMLGGGHIRGWRVPSNCEFETIVERVFAHEYVDAENERREPMLIAVGDGNHSLAAAKLAWETLKSTLDPSERASHPARYALVEIVNLHSPALEFTAIHRALSGADVAELAAYLMRRCDESDDGQGFLFAHGDVRTRLRIVHPQTETSVGSLQKLLDAYLSDRAGTLDYIHGDAVALELAKQPGCAAMLLDPIPKSQLFKSVARGGPLERKSFSMGHAADKRYYLEARRITK